MKPVDGDKIAERIRNLWREFCDIKEDDEEYEYNIGMCGGLSSTCDLCKPCRRYVRRDKIDDYIRHLLEELDYYYKLP